MRGSVRKRGDTWYYSFEAAPINGKRKRIERPGGNTKKQAEKALREALSAYEKAGSHHTDRKEISVSDYFDFWYRSYVIENLKFNSQKSYKLQIEKHIKPEFGIYRLFSAE